jgi:hypothetical protein
MDQLYPFAIGAGEQPLQINPRTGCPGLLELRLVSGEKPVYLFRGAVSLEEAAQGLKGPQPMWDLATILTGGPSCVVWDGNESFFSIYSAAAAVGYVRISEIVCNDLC